MPHTAAMNVKMLRYFLTHQYNQRTCKFCDNSNFRYSHKRTIFYTVLFLIFWKKNYGSMQLIFKRNHVIQCVILIADSMEELD